ncbi:helicase-related protein, partial [Catellatospora coxensis]|uniref:helicase-related protein n=1 Tax=Catellatospora coxensis TaxID=310354 RepID=UPI0031DEC1B5
MTQERLLAVPVLPSIDLFFIDEFYKLADEKDGLLDQRSSILNQAFLRLARTGAQFYFAGPVVEGLSELLPENFRASFIRTNFTTVAADTIRLDASNDAERIARTVELVGVACEPTLVYCQSPQKTRKVLEELISVRSERAQDSPGLPDAASWIEENYHPDWIVAKALRLGIGVHHGRLPRWLAQRVVQGFESGDLDVLVCTNSLIEGVNTRAKRIIILDRNIANRAYNYFTFANIKGRVGRMFKHFVGQIYLFHDEPRRELPNIDIPGVTQSDSAPGSLLVQIEEDD